MCATKCFIAVGKCEKEVLENFFHKVHKKYIFAHSRNISVSVGLVISETFTDQSMDVCDFGFSVASSSKQLL